MAVSRIQNFFSAIAGFVVFVAFSAIVAGVVFVLYLQILEIENAVEPSLSSTFSEIASGSDPNSNNDGRLELVLRATLDSEAQILRSQRSQSLAGSRLMVQVLAEIIALSLIVLGGTLVFARIRALGIQDSISVGLGSAPSDQPQRFAQLKSTWPGVLLCAFGTFLAVSVLYFSVHANSKIWTGDGVLFLESFNDSAWISNSPRSDVCDIDPNFPNCS